MAERTEDEILSLAPIKVKFGEKEYSLKLRRMLAAREWRNKFTETIAEITHELGAEIVNADSFKNGFGFVYLQFPDKIADLVFCYDPELPREEIEQIASDEQVSRAFGKIMDVAFPFFSQLQMAQTILKSVSQLASVRLTK